MCTELKSIAQGQHMQSPSLFQKRKELAYDKLNEAFE